MLSLLLGSVSAWVSAFSFLFSLLDLESARLKAVKDLLKAGPKIPSTIMLMLEKIFRILPIKPIKRLVKYCYADVQVFAG